MIIECTWMHFIDGEMLDYHKWLSDTAVLACMVCKIYKNFDLWKFFLYFDLFGNFHSVMAPHGKELLLDLKQTVISLHQDKQGYNKIAKTLKLSKYTVAKVVQKYKIMAHL